MDAGSNPARSMAWSHPRCSGQISRIGILAAYRTAAAEKAHSRFDSGPMHVIRR